MATDTTVISQRAMQALGEASLDERMAEAIYAEGKEAVVFALLELTKQLAETMPYSVLQPILVHDGIEDLLSLHDARQPDSSEAAYCRRLLQQPPEVLDPQPLLTGDDLIRHGVPRGPQYRVLLDRVRAAQLDREIHTKDEAMAMVDQILKEQ